MKAAINETVDIPQGVTLTVTGDTIHIKGPKGEVTKQVIPRSINAEFDTKEATLKCARPTQREKRLLFTAKARLKNYVKGVHSGHIYKLQICSSHFPMSVTIKGSTLEVKNFIGEKVPRTLAVPQGATVKIDGSVVEVTGYDLDVVAQCAASIERLTRRPGFDRRIFQDGIYITIKDGEAI